MKIAVAAFTGIRPASAAHLLQNNEAQVADNCHLQSGDIRQIARPVKTTGFTVVNVDSFMLYDMADEQEWLVFTDEGTSVVAGHIYDDEHGRCYMTDDDGAQMFTVNDVIAATLTPNKLGIPAPMATPGVSVTGSGSGDSYSTAYVFTLVSEFGEEGRPSPVSSIVTVTPGQTVDLTGLTTPTVTGYNTMEYKRIYRLNTGESGSTEYQFVDEIDVADTTYSDTVLSEDLGEVLPSENWYEPPTGLQGMIRRNGLYAGFIGRDLWYCEQGYPHAWPLSYNQTVESDIVGHCFSGDYQIVFTKSKVYVVDTTDMSYAVPRALEGNCPCMSAKGIVSTEFGVFFPGQDGLYLVAAASTSAINVSKGYWSERDWKELNPASMKAVWHLQKLFCFYENLSGEKRGFVLDFNAESGISMVRGLAFSAEAAYVEPDGNDLYLAYEEGSRTNISKWEGSILAYRASWKSKKFKTPEAVNMAAAKIEAEFREGLSEEEFEARRLELIASYTDFLDEGEFYGAVGDAGPGEYPFAGDALDSLFIQYVEVPQITFRVYGDGVLRHSQEVNTNSPFLLPAGYTATEWELEISADVPVSEMAVAPSMMELLA